MLDAFTQLIQQHAKDVAFCILGWIVFSSLTSALPEPDTKSGKPYIFLHAFCHALSFNLKQSAVSFMRLVHMLPAEPPKEP